VVKPSTVSTPVVKPEAKAVPVSISTKTSDSGHRYSIQLGYFSDESNASKMLEKARANKFAEPRILTSHRSGTSFYRVVVGNCVTLHEAQVLLGDVTAAGLKGAVYGL